MQGPADGAFEGAPAGGLTRQALSGLKWTYGSTVASATLQIGYTAVMGRLLTDTDFGLIAMAQLVVTLAQHFANAGVASALVQKAEVTRADIRVAVTSSTLLGVVLAGGVVLAAPLAGELFDSAQVVTVVRVMAIALLVQSAGHTALGLLRRDLRFRTLAGVEVASHGVGYLAVGIGMAAAGFGVWSLVGAAIGAQGLRTIFAYACTRHSLVPLLRWQEFKVLYGYGGRLSVISFMEFVGSALDVTIIGRYAGQGPLGQWNRASLLLNLPFSYAIGGLSKVLFPTFSKIQTDLVRVRRGYLGAIRFTAALLIPTAAGMAAASDELVRVLLGPDWDQAAALLPLLAISAVTGLLSHFGGIVCDATAQLNRKMALQAVFLAALATGLFAVRDEPLVVIASVVACAQVFRHVLYMLLIRRVLGVTARQYAEPYLPPILTGAIVAALLWGIGALGDTLGAPALLVLPAQVAVGGAVVVVSLRWGPLRGIGRDLHDRLSWSGVLTRGGRLPALIARVLGVRR